MNNKMKQEAATTATTYPTPPGIEPSEHYSVKVNGQETFVYITKAKVPPVNWYLDQFTSGSVSFTMFSFTDGPITVEVTNLSGEQIENVVIRPLNKKIQSSFEGTKVKFTLVSAAYVSVEINRQTTRRLFIFADEPERDVPNPQDPAVIYFKPGVYRIGKNYDVPEGKTLYIAGGAYLKGTILSRSNNATVRGRGIISGEEYERDEGPGCCWLKGESTIIDGIICIDSPGWCLSANTVANCKAIGWHTNTDGVWPKGPGGLVRNFFHYGADDGVVLYPGCVIEDCVIWTNNGAAIQLGWGSFGRPTGPTLVKNIDIIHVDGYSGIKWYLMEDTDPVDSYAFKMFNSGTDHIENITIENVRIENIRECYGRRLFSLCNGRNPYMKQPEIGHCQNITFRNITCDSPTDKNFIMAMDQKAYIDNIRFENLWVDGRYISESSQINCLLNEFVTNVSFVVTAERPPQIPSSPIEYVVNACRRMHAQDFSGRSGVGIYAPHPCVEPCSEGGECLTQLYDGSWTSYERMDFGTDITGFEVRALAKNIYGHIELRLDAPLGKLIGICQLSPTGRWQTYGCNIKSAFGEHDLYLIYKGCLVGLRESFVVNWFRFL
jgi:hypothetical protein